MKTVLLSKVIPGGTKGEEPVAKTVFLHVKILSIPLLLERKRVAYTSTLKT